MKVYSSSGQILSHPFSQLLLCFGLVLPSACNHFSKEATCIRPIEINRYLVSSSEAVTYTIKGENGFSMTVSNYGASLISLKNPDRNGEIDEVILGLDRPPDYLKFHPFFGATIGRYSGRLDPADLIAKGASYELKSNLGNLHFHGGKKGFNRRFWTAKLPAGTCGNSVEFTLSSLNGDEGYPGNLEAKVTYSVIQNQLHIDSNATADQAGPFNMTSHIYFNLGGQTERAAADHHLMIPSQEYFAMDSRQIPLPNLIETRNSPFDFQIPQRVSDGLKKLPTQLEAPAGYDHLFRISPRNISDSPPVVANLYDEKTGRNLELRASLGCLAFYSGNHLNGFVGRGHRKYSKHYGLLLEPQACPVISSSHGILPAQISSQKPYKSQTQLVFSVR